VCITAERDTATGVRRAGAVCGVVSGTLWTRPSRRATMRWLVRRKNFTCSSILAGALATTTAFTPRRNENYAVKTHAALDVLMTACNALYNGFCWSFFHPTMWSDLQGGTKNGHWPFIDSSNCHIVESPDSVVTCASSGGIIVNLSWSMNERITRMRGSAIRSVRS